jgi:hypothetical protein
MALCQNKVATKVPYPKDWAIPWKIKDQLPNILILRLS